MGAELHSSAGVPHGKAKGVGLDSEGDKCARFHFVPWEREPNVDLNGVHEKEPYIRSERRRNRRVYEKNREHRGKQCSTCAVHLGNERQAQRRGAHAFFAA